MQDNRGKTRRVRFKSGKNRTYQNILNILLGFLFVGRWHDLRSPLGLFKIEWVENTFFSILLIVRRASVLLSISAICSKVNVRVRVKIRGLKYFYLRVCVRGLKNFQIRTNFRVRVYILENFNVRVRVRMDCWFHWKFPWLKVSEELPAILMEFVNVGWSFCISFC